MSRRTSHLPRNSRWSAMASVLDKISTRICETKAKRMVVAQRPPEARVAQRRLEVLQPDEVEAVPPARCWSGCRRWPARRARPPAARCRGWRAPAVPGRARARRPPGLTPCPAADGRHAQAGLGVEELQVVDLAGELVRFARRDGEMDGGGQVDRSSWCRGEVPQRAVEESIGAKVLDAGDLYQKLTSGSLLEYTALGNRFSARTRPAPVVLEELHRRRAEEPATKVSAGSS